MTSQSNTPLDRGAIIARIRKLAQVTLDRGASEAEAAFAAKRLAVLMAEYEVKQDELSLRRDAAGCVKDEYQIIARSANWSACLWEVAKMFKVKSWRENGFDDPLDLGISEPVVKFHLYGFPQDVEAVSTLMRIIHIAALAKIAKYTKETKRGRHVASFELGFASRIKALCNEIIAEREALRATGTALLVLKDQLVTSEFTAYCREHNLRFRNTRSSTVTNGAAYAAGQAAGSRVNLRQSQQVGSGLPPYREGLVH
jgi:hypothetical protein